MRITTVAMRALLGLCLIAAVPSIAAAAGLAGPTRVDAGAATRPAAVPAGYVVTPNGYFHPSCVYQIADGEQVRADGAIARADGSVRALIACGYPHFTAAGERIEATAGGLRSKQPVVSGWVAYSDTDPNAPSAVAGSIAAYWTVPPAPTLSGTQVVYFFPGLEAVPNVVTIVQPVLGWNAFNDHAWTLSSWNCCVNGSTTNSTPITVAIGDQIYGLATGNCSGSSICSSWNILSKDLTTGQQTVLITSAYNQAFNWFFGGVLEAYNVASCSQYPASSTLSFTGIKVTDVNGVTLAPTWINNLTGARPSCSYSVSNTSTTTTIGFGGRGN